MLGAVLGGVRIDLHAAHGINRELGSRGCLMRRTMIVRSLCHGLVLHTPRGYIDRMRKEAKSSSLKRLGRIEGQVRGLVRMVEGERYCIDIVTQISAVRAALRRVEEEVLSDHIAHCVDHAIKSGDRREQRKKVAELMDVVRRAER